MLIGNRCQNNLGLNRCKGNLKVGTCTNMAKTLPKTSCDNVHYFQATQKWNIMPEADSNVVAECSNMPSSLKCIQNNHPIVVRPMFDEISVASSLLVRNCSAQ